MAWTASPPGSSAQPVEHGGGGVDRPHVEPAGGEGHGQPAAARAELEHAPAGAGERRHPADRGVHVGDVGVPVVVDVGEAVAVGAGSVSVHVGLPIGGSPHLGR